MRRSKKKDAMTDHDANIKNAIVCPVCGSAEITTVQRNWWLYLIPGGRQHACDDCGKSFILIFHRFLWWVY
ncbi:MAG: hypothetical protein KKD86_05055 [Bacteroidetes bacterium]|nr:hypothetical protein [Bacteroidota bacterium]MBU1678209.1 hypothetical protein [Bacteroidota bacterium]